MLRASCSRSIVLYTGRKLPFNRVRFVHALPRLDDLPSTSKDYLQNSSEFSSFWNGHGSETVSLDDFGVVSVDSRVPKRAEGLPLDQFFDRMFRPVPTSESDELGGSIELQDLGDLESFDAISTGNQPVEVKSDFSTKRSALAAFGVLGSGTAALSPGAVDVPVIPEPLVVLPSGPLSAEDLISAVDNQERVMFFKSIHGMTWPSALEFGNRLHDVLVFVARGCDNTEEGIALLEAFSSVNPKTYIRDEVHLILMKNACQERGITFTTETISRCRQSFPIRPPKSRNPSMKQLYQELFNHVVEKGGVLGALSVVESLAKHRFLEDSKVAVNVISKAIFAQNNRDFSSNLHDWKTVSHSFSTADGLDVLLDSMICSSENGMQYLDEVLKHSKLYSHPFSTLAELICSFVRQNKVEEAKLVFNKVFITGRYFNSPLRRLVSVGDLRSVEALAALVSDCMFAEKRRGISKKSTTSIESEALLMLGESVDKFTGAARRENPKKKRFQEQKKKRHRLNEEQLHELASNIRDAWSKLAKSCGDDKSAEELRSWCDRNGVALQKKN